jgi:hypothetical protein
MGPPTAADTTNGTGDMTDPIKPAASWWRPLVDGVDRRVTPPANRLMRTNLFADYIAVATRLEARLRRRIERQTTWLLHQYNLPAAGDIRKVRAQLATVEARIRDMSERLEDMQHEAHTNGSGTGTPAPSAPRPAP